jgi:hypothetical protein
MIELERRMRALEDVEAIKRLKYRYWRCLDLKLWDEMADCFAKDATASWGDGRYAFRGREEILRFLRDALGRERGSITIHHGHHPEIDLVGEDAAIGTWALDNYLFNVRDDRALRMGAYYSDRYARIEGAWRITHVGYQVVFEETWRRSALATLEVRSPFL